MFRIIRDYIYSLVGLLASIITLTLFLDRFYPALSQDGRVGMYFLGSLLIWFFLESLYLKVRWGRERRYAQTIEVVSEGFGEIHKLHRQASDIRNTIAACERLCNSTAEAFSLITGTKCNTSIKILTEDVDEAGNTKLKAITFARNRDRGRNPKPNPVRHWVDRNTDFMTILEKIDTPKGELFFSNLLVFRFGYQNTSFMVYGEPPDNNWVLRYWRWPLPYKSTIVVPICPCAEPASSNLVGFFCVDSSNVGAFKKDFDVPLIQGIADGVFNTINEVHKQTGTFVGPEVPST